MDLSQEIGDLSHIRGIVIGIGGISETKLLEHFRLLRDCSRSIALADFALQLATPAIGAAFPRLDTNQAVIKLDLAIAPSVSPSPASTPAPLAYGNAGAAASNQLASPGSAAIPAGPLGLPIPAASASASPSAGSGGPPAPGIQTPIASRAAGGAGTPAGSSTATTSSSSDSLSSPSVSGSGTPLVARSATGTPAGAELSAGPQQQQQQQRRAPSPIPRSSPQTPAVLSAAHASQPIVAPGLYSAPTSIPTIAAPKTTLLNAGFSSAPGFNDELIDFHFSKRTLVIFGIINCQHTVDLRLAYREFQAACSQFPTVLDVRCFAFEPQDAQEDNEKHVILIPNQAREHVQFYISTILNDMTLSLVHLLAAAHHSKIAERDDKKLLPSLLLERTGGIDDARFYNANRKKIVGRFEKLAGDICLLVGSPDDAIVHYTEAIEQTKSANDWLYLAGCLECFAATLLVKHKMGDPLVLSDFVEKCNDALANYTKVKGAGPFEIELMVKLAKFFVARRAFLEAAQALQDIPRVDAQLSIDDQIRLVSSLILLYQAINFKRKAAFYMRRLSLLFTKGVNRTDMVVSHYLLLQCLPAHFLGSLFEFLNRPSDNSAVLPLLETSLRASGLGWQDLQARIMRELIYASRHINDPKKTVLYISYFLHRLHDFLSHSEQCDLAQKLATSTSMLQFAGGGLLFQKLPNIHRVFVPTPPPHLEIRKRETQAVKKELFIYTPFGKRSGPSREKTMYWAQGELLQLQIELSNDMAFPMLVEAIQLTTSGSPFSSLPISTTVPPHTAAMNLSVFGTAKVHGTVRVRSVISRVFGVNAEHAIPPISLTIVPEMPVMEILLNPNPTQHGTTLKMYHGQFFDTSLIVTNSSNVVVDYFSSKLTVKAEPGHFFQQPSDTLSTATLTSTSSNSDEIASQNDQPCTFPQSAEIARRGIIPLQPGHQASLPLGVWALRGFCGATLTCEYGSTAVPDFYRQSVIDFPIESVPLLEFSNFDILASSSDHIASSQVLPESATRDSFCVLALDVTNSSHVSAQVAFAACDAATAVSQTPVTMNALSAMRVYLPIRRFALSEQLLRTAPPPTDPSRQFVVTRERQWSSDEIALYWFQKKLAQLYRVEWSLPMSSVRGLVQLDNIQLSKDALIRLRPKELSVGLSIAGEAAIDRQTVCCPLLEFVPITLRVANCSGEVFSSLESRVEVLLDLHNGLVETDLSARVMWTGTMCMRHTELAPNQACDHQIQLLFLSPGTYTLVQSASATRENCAAADTAERSRIRLVVR
ncbi:hypothetical protein CAOG_06323 [Capsaspora owczarzaki ATCC 30864]|uniref:Uncharacterized protein n=1 Tax=Capsaspora owczarzaki (strain ATCC 30864) TaxID=595528 RepID=A0A0D2X4E8_CAPO3|nr:hypothetical protein CAOG_06323 [Capsaspora owczarzaki ATCC 30864]KJE95934.1 hypothetical protein CAOG_006323 [Capsaspora owczarzaki ATCC 30864]|eukprot:XP_004345072.1 hypothetical protein CAOG_06323 [Capsaspora owczarzaki ATCC 30864]